MLELSFKLILVSVLSVAAIDVWQRLFYKLGGLPPTNWKLTGRWLLVLLRERIVFNKSLSNTPAVTGEAAAGWVLHYAVGGVYVLVYYVLWKYVSLLTPTLSDGLVFGVISIVVPWFFFMPAMGAGLCARHTPPSALCMQRSPCYPQRIWHGIGSPTGCVGIKNCLSLETPHHRAQLSQAIRDSSRAL